MRLTNVHDIGSANTFLQTYLPARNERFGVASADAQDAHPPCTFDKPAKYSIRYVQPINTAVDDKTLNPSVGEILKQCREASKPAHDYPWRNTHKQSPFAACPFLKQKGEISILC